MIEKDLSQCYKKSRYSSEFKANEYVKKAKLERSIELRTYYCNICMGWHLTKGLNAKKEVR